MPRLDPAAEAKVRDQWRRHGRERLNVAAPIFGGLLARTHVSGESDRLLADRALELAEELIRRNRIRTQDDIDLALHIEQSRLTRDARAA